MTEAFKVTRSKSDPTSTRRHYSSIAPDRFLREYTTAKPTIAKIGGLLVFTSISHALAFIERELIQGVSLWRVDCEDKVELGRRADILDMMPQKRFATDFVIRCWEGLTCIRRTTRAWPSGTLAFKEVILTEQLLGPGMEV